MFDPSTSFGSLPTEILGVFLVNFFPGSHRMVDGTPELMVWYGAGRGLL